MSKYCDEAAVARAWAETHEPARYPHQVASPALRRMLLLLRAAAQRITSTGAPLPLVIEEPFVGLDRRARALSKALLAKAGQVTQVVVAGADPGVFDAAQVVELPPVVPGPRSYASYSYDLPLDAPAPLPADAPSGQFDYVLGDRVAIDEDRLTELKEVLPGSDPIAAVGKIVERYAVAFLNSTRSAGRILWGIRDDKRVIGVQLNDAQRDELRKSVGAKLQSITPPPAPSAYRIDLHPVGSGGRAVEDLFVIEVAVAASGSALLHAAGAHNVYVKTDAGIKRLTAVEIQREALARASAG